MFAAEIACWEIEEIATTPQRLEVQNENFSAYNERNAPRETPG